MDKKYTNIEDVSTPNLIRMLDMDRYQDYAHQKMIEDELKFRRDRTKNFETAWSKQSEQLAFKELIDAFRGV
tara:strand:+ start:329 stop:544 length:216 start_codon:yes stop_codon:yes gene_type:complete